jgi:hypothetical protein
MHWYSQIIHPTAERFSPSVLSRHTGTYTERPVSGRLRSFSRLLYSISLLVELRTKSCVLGTPNPVASTALRSLHPALRPGTTAGSFAFQGSIKVDSWLALLWDGAAVRGEAHRFLFVGCQIRVPRKLFRVQWMQPGPGTWVSGPSGQWQDSVAGASGRTCWQL